MVEASLFKKSGKSPLSSKRTYLEIIRYALTPGNKGRSVLLSDSTGKKLDRSGKTHHDLLHESGKAIGPGLDALYLVR